MNEIKTTLSSITPTLNSLSDYDAQILTIKNTYTKIKKFSLKERIRLMD